MTQTGAFYPLPGEVIDGKYQVEKLIGEGGMGAVARAVHTLRNAPVALKFMSPHFARAQGAVDRFINEARAASQIESDHVVQIFDVGKLPNGAPYLVMEYLDGLDLAQLLVRDGRPGLPIPRAVHFVLQVLRALQVAHAAGVVHRDMKPSNCFIIRKDGEEDFVKILDFGISKQTGAALTSTHSALGTPLYMSPEQARSPRDVDGRSDLYSVGVILYELLTGSTPFTSESGELTEILFKLFTTDVPPILERRPDLSPALAEIVHHALTREADHRFGSALEMAEALAPFGGPEAQNMLARMRTHVGRKSKMPSGAAIPAAVAFERLPTRHGLGTAPPPAPVYSSPLPPGAAASMPHVALPQGGFAPAPVPRPVGAPPGVPQAASAHTDYADARQTDMGAARDRSENKPRSAVGVVVVLGLLALVALVGVGWGVRVALRGSSPSPHADTPISATQEPPRPGPGASTSGLAAQPVLQVESPAPSASVDGGNAGKPASKPVTTRRPSVSDDPFATQPHN